MLQFTTVTTFVITRSRILGQTFLLLPSSYLSFFKYDVMYLLTVQHGGFLERQARRAKKKH
jgi:hypothetical protein